MFHGPRGIVFGILDVCTEGILCLLAWEARESQVGGPGLIGDLSVDLGRLV